MKGVYSATSVIPNHYKAFYSWLIDSDILYSNCFTVKQSARKSNLAEYVTPGLQGRSMQLQREREREKLKGNFSKNFTC